MAYLEYIDDDEYERFKRKQREGREREKAAAASRVDDTWRKAQRSESVPDFALSGPRTSYEPAIAARGTSGGLTAGYDAPAYYEPTPRVSDADVAESAVRMGVDPWQVAQEQARQNRPGDEGIRQTLAAPVRFVGQNISKPIAGLGAEIGRLGWEGMEKATDTGSGLATELLGGRPQEQYESLRGLSRSDIPDIAERQKKRREMGLAYMPVGEFLPMTASEVGPIARGLQAGLKAVPRETMAAASILKEGFQTAAPVARKAGRVLGDVTTSPEVRRLTPGGTVAEAAEGTKRYYHGTGSAFESPEAARFDPNGLYGPGYYLTDSPEVAGGIVNNAGTVLKRGYAQRRGAPEHIAPSDDIVARYKSQWEPVVTRVRKIQQELDDAMAKGGSSYAAKRPALEAARMAEEAKLDALHQQMVSDTILENSKGAAVRIVNVPENLRLLDAEAPVPKELAQSLEQRFSTFNDRGLTGDRFDEALSMLPDNPTGHDLYKALYWTGERDSEWLQIQLQSLGYDGLRYQGGKRTPMRDAAGNPIEHEVIVIFPESLPKITNALSGRPMGVAPETVGAVGGAVQGASTVEEDDSPEEAARKVMTSAAIGGLGVAGVMRGAKALPEVARRIVPRLGVEDVGRGLPDIDEALAAIRNAPTAEELVNLRKGTMSRYPPTSAEGKAILGAAQARFGQLSGELPERQIGRVGDESAAIGGVADVRSTQTIGAQVDTLPQTTGQLESTRQMAEVPRTIEGIAGTPPPQEPPTSGTQPIVPPVRGYPAKTAGFEQVWNRDRNVLEHQGEAGRELAGRIHESREVAHTRAGDWISRMPTVRKLSKAEFNNFVDVAEAKGNPLNIRVAQASREWDEIRQEIWATSQNVGLDVGTIKDYFPHRYDPKIFQSVDRWNRALEHLVKSGQAPDRTAAEQMLDKAREATFTRFGNLERERLVDLPDYERTPQALMDYVYGSAERIGQAAQFGPENEIGARLVTEIGRQGGDTGAAKNILKRTLGTKEYGQNWEKMSRAVRSFNVLTKMGLSFLSNATQPLNTASVAGAMRTVTNIPRAAFSQEAKEYALRIGVTVDGVIQDVREGAGWSGNIAKVGSPLFNRVEQFNRTLTALAGRDFARDMAERWRRSGGKDGEAGEALRAMKLDPEVISIRKGRLTGQEEMQASRNVVERTQFYVDAQDLPGWAGHPLGKVVTQFRTFAYNQTAFVARELLEPAIKHRNIKPLVTFLVLGVPTGAATLELQNFLRNRPSEEDPVQRIRQYAQRVGALGVVGDLLAGLAPPNTKYLPAERYALQAAGTAFGPTMGTYLEGVGSVATALQGNPEGIERWALKQIPVVGPTIKNTLLPYKPGGRGGASVSPFDAYMQGRGNLQLSPMDSYLQNRGRDDESPMDKYLRGGR